MMMVLPDEDGPNSLVRMFPATDISTFFICTPPPVKARLPLVFAGPSSLRLQGKEQTPALGIDLAGDQLAAVGRGELQAFLAILSLLGRLLILHLLLGGLLLSVRRAALEEKRPGQGRGHDHAACLQQAPARDPAGHG